MRYIYIYGLPYYVSVNTVKKKQSIPLNQLGSTDYVNVHSMKNCSITHKMNIIKIIICFNKFFIHLIRYSKAFLKSISSNFVETFQTEPGYTLYRIQFENSIGSINNSNHRTKWRDLNKSNGIRWSSMESELMQPTYILLTSSSNSTCDVMYLYTSVLKNNVASYKFSQRQIVCSNLRRTITAVTVRIPCI